MRISSSTKIIAAVVAIAAIAAGYLMSASPNHYGSADGQASTPNTENADVVVYKTANCGCCTDWVAHLEKSELEVAVINVPSTAPARERQGVPGELGSCHTAVVGDYWVEGHVPADLVRRLMTERPDDVEGIAVPGMPMGSPGMEGANPVKYDVIAYHTDGSTSVYATRQGKSSSE